MATQKTFDQLKSEILGDNRVLNSLDEADALHDKLIKLCSDTLFEIGFDMMPHYRGEQNKDWNLSPGIYRPNSTITDPILGKQLEKQAVDLFEKTVKDKFGPEALRKLFNKERFGREWDLLFQAQHAGVKTTLTDWSANIISAAYFATENWGKSPEPDGQLWILIVPRDKMLGHTALGQKSLYNKDPFQMTDTYLINSAIDLDGVESRLFEYRMYKQKGRFLILQNTGSNTALNKQERYKDLLLQYVIPNEKKKGFREDLAKRNVTRATQILETNGEADSIVKFVNDEIFGKYFP